MDDFFKLPGLPVKRKIEDEERQEVQEVELSPSKLDPVQEALAQMDKVQAMGDSEAKKIVSSLEKAHKMNQLQRAKYSSQPDKFLESEMELHVQIHQLLQLSSQTSYLKYLKQSVGTIMELLVHENPDICGDMLEVLSGLTDEESLPQENLSTLDILKEFLDALIENQLIQVLAENALKFDVKQPEQDQTLYHLLSFVENMIDIQAEYAQSFLENDKFIDFLLNCVKLQHETKLESASLYYTTEILFILLQSNTNETLLSQLLENTKILLLLLESLSQWLKKDPTTPEELEFFENIVGCCCCLVKNETGKQKFITEEGMELFFLILEQKNLCSLRIWKILSFLLTGLNSSILSPITDSFVDQGGLKHLFSHFMHKNLPYYKKKYAKDFSVNELEEQTLTIMISLFRFLESKEPQFRLNRLLMKFKEKQFEKTNRLVELFQHFLVKVDQQEQELQKQLEEDEEELEEDEIYFELLGQGLLQLQYCSIIILSLFHYSIQDDHQEELLGVYEQIGQQMKRKQIPLTKILQVVVQYKDYLSEEAHQEKIWIEELLKPFQK